MGESFGVPLFYARKKPRLSTRAAGVFTQQSECKRDRYRVIVFLFFFYTDFFNFIHRRLAGPTAGRKSDRGKIKPGKTQSQDLALWIVHGCINIYLNFFLSTCCGFNFFM